jgi:hypothetical protein
MFEYEFDYPPAFIKECDKVVKNCPSFKEDLNIELAITHYISIIL